MTPLTALLLLALGMDTDAKAHFPGATPVFQCTFDSSRDDDLYGWPPGWTRRQGPGFPRYVRVRVDEKRPPSGGYCLRVDLDGGAATAYSPAISTNSNVQYVLEGYVETAALRHDAAYLSLIFLDQTRTKIGSLTSEKISGDSPWKKLQLGPISPPAGAVSMLVGLHVEPQGEAQDLHGTASFGALWLGQVPHVVLTAQPAALNTPAERKPPADQAKAGRDKADEKPGPTQISAASASSLFPPGQPIEIACVVSGFEAPAYEIRLELFDSDGRSLGEHRQRFDQSGPAANTGKQKSTPSVRATWRLPVDSVGYYRVRGGVVPVDPSLPPSPPAAPSVTAAASNVELSLAIIEPHALPSGSEFGWSLSPNDADLGLAPLGDLLCKSGVRWVKFPFAITETAAGPAKPSAANSLEPLINFSDRLGTAGVSLVGVLLPPRVPADAVSQSHTLLAVEAFARDPKTWYPSIEPILARLGTQIRSWQIGDDRDQGWIGCRDLLGIVSKTKAELDQICQDLDIGIPWNLAAPLPVAPPNSKADRRSYATLPSSPIQGSKPPKTPWRFLSLPCDDEIGNDAIARLLESTKSAGVERWVVLDALPRDGHAPAERISHLVDRILTAKMHGADAIFIANPLDLQRGLVDRSGQPSELFLPWRTTALMLGGATYAGDIDLPNGNQIRCFAGNDKYVGVLAGQVPVQETVYLGSELRTCDLWGRRRACPPTVADADGREASSPAPRSEIAVAELPIFLVGLDRAITQWQLGVAFSPDRLPSIPSAPASVALQVTNPFSQPVSGRVSIRGPKNWYLEPRTAEFRMEAGASWKQRLEVALPNDVVAGRQMVQLDFEIEADHVYRFAMVRPLDVTLGDVVFEGHAALNSNGDMEVRQTLTNESKRPTGFRCDLLVPDRQRQSNEVLLQPYRKSELTYRLPDGQQLLGKTIWLRAEEIDGPRVLNYRVETPAATASGEKSKPRPASRSGSSLVL